MDDGKTVCFNAEMYGIFGGVTGSDDYFWRIIMKRIKFIAGLLSAAMCMSVMTVPRSGGVPVKLSASAVTVSEFPEEYKYAADWIWTNRIEREKSTERRNTIFDQIEAGRGTINYVVKWQS